MSKKYLDYCKKYGNREIKSIWIIPDFCGRVMGICANCNHHDFKKLKTENEIKDVEL